MDIWELIARERIRDTLATYNWSGDAFRLDELAAAFCDDGVLELRGGPTLTGRDEIVAFLSGVRGGAGDTSTPPPAVTSGGQEQRKIVRHVLTNTRFLELEPDHARVASYFTVITQIGLDHHGRYRDDLVPVDDRWLIRRRFVSTDWHAPDSLMAR